MAQAPSERHLAELRTDLQVERAKLRVLVESLAALQRVWDVPDGSQERCDAAALRLQSLYTGIERFLCRSCVCSMAGRLMVRIGTGAFWIG
jgi:hypothetical protein